MLTEVDLESQKPFFPLAGTYILSYLHTGYVHTY